ncbi:MAG: FtsL-like putative cell division protein [Chitinophagaceae bacterium]
MEQKTDQYKKNKTGNTGLKAIGGNLISGQWITKNIQFFLFLSVLVVVYIANGHLADKTIYQINNTQKKLKDLQFEYKTLKSEVMYRSEEAQILKAAEPLGLKISKEVPVRLQAEFQK